MGMDAFVRGLSNRDMKLNNHLHLVPSLPHMLPGVHRGKQNCLPQMYDTLQVLYRNEASTHVTFNVRRSSDYGPVACHIVWTRVATQNTTIRAFVYLFYWQIPPKKEK